MLLDTDGKHFTLILDQSTKSRHFSIVPKNVNINVFGSYQSKAFVRRWSFLPLTSLSTTKPMTSSSASSSSPSSPPAADPLQSLPHTSPHVVVSPSLLSYSTLLCLPPFKTPLIPHLLFLLFSSSSFPAPRPLSPLVSISSSTSAPPLLSLFLVLPLLFCVL